jgi:hypothetical protein
LKNWVPDLRGGFATRLSKTRGRVLSPMMKNVIYEKNVFYAGRL